MTTDESPVLNTRSSLPPLVNIKYPNCSRGMYSLRRPVRDSYTPEKQQQPDVYTPRPTPRPVLHPEYLHINRRPPEEQPSHYQRPSQQDAEVQCSLPPPIIDRDEIAVRRTRTVVRDAYESDDLSPRYRVQLNLRPAQPNIYEVWNVETPPPRSIPLHQPSQRRNQTPPPAIRIRSPRLVNIQPLSDEESWYDDDDEDDDNERHGILYARYPRRTHPPRNVRMIHMRQDANTIRF